QIVNCKAVSALVGDSSRVATTLLAPVTGEWGPQSLTWQSGWNTPLGEVLENGDQFLALQDAPGGNKKYSGWWTSLCGSTSPAIPGWGWSTTQAQLDGDLAGPNIFQIARCFVFGNPLGDPPFVWFASPKYSRDSLILGSWRRV